MNLQFQVVKSSSIKTQTITCRTSKSEKSLEEKFLDKKREILRRDKRKLRNLHFVTIIHDAKLFVLDGNGKIRASFDNPESLKTMILARQVYVEAIRKSPKQEGGCYFN